MPEFPTWNSKLDARSKRIFSVGAKFFSEFPIVLNSLKSEISLFQVSSCFELSQYIANVECLSF